MINVRCPMLVIIQTKPLAYGSDKIENCQDDQCVCEQLDARWLDPVLLFFFSIFNAVLF